MARLLFAGRIASLLVGTAGPGVIPAAVRAAAARVTTALERRAGRAAATEQEAGAELD